MHSRVLESLPTVITQLEFTSHGNLPSNSIHIKDDENLIKDNQNCLLRHPLSSSQIWLIVLYEVLHFDSFVEIKKVHEGASMAP